MHIWTPLSIVVALLLLGGFLDLWTVLTGPGSDLWRQALILKMLAHMAVAVGLAFRLWWAWWLAVVLSLLWFAQTLANFRADLLHPALRAIGPVWPIVCLVILYFMRAIGRRGE